MKCGVLEVLLVGAEGFRRTSLFGNKGYYVAIQCGKVTYRSKITSGKGKTALWNEKFIFKFPVLDWPSSTQLCMKIIDRHFFSKDDFLGETIIHLGGVLEEGSQNGKIEVKPSSYNIVTEDGTYDGDIKIGLKYIGNVEVDEAERQEPREQPQPLTSIHRTIFNFIKVPCLRFLSHLNHGNSKANMVQV